MIDDRRNCDKINRYFSVTNSTQKPCECFFVIFFRNRPSFIAYMVVKIRFRETQPFRDITRRKINKHKRPRSSKVIVNVANRKACCEFLSVTYSNFTSSFNRLRNTNAKSLLFRTPLYITTPTEDPANSFRSFYKIPLLIIISVLYTDCRKKICRLATANDRQTDGLDGIADISSFFTK